MIEALSKESTLTDDDRKTLAAKLKEMGRQLVERGEPTRHNSRTVSQRPSDSRLRVVPAWSTFQESTRGPSLICAGWARADR